MNNNRICVTIGDLEGIGIKLLIGKMTGSLLSPKYRNEMVKAYVKEHGGTEAAAKVAIAQMTRVAAAELVGDAAKVAKNQLTYGNI